MRAPLCQRTYAQLLKQSKLTLCPKCLAIYEEREARQRAEEKKQREEERQKHQKARKKRQETLRQKQSKFAVPRLGYRFELFKLNSKSLPLFVFPENRRRISQSQVASLCKLLYNGKHFDSPIVVNKVDGMYRLVDGNHRIEAFKKVLQKHPRFSMDILLIIYTNLDGDGEIEAFRKWNVGKVQSTDDFIQSIAHKVDFIKWLMRDFPVDITIYKIMP